MLFACGSLSPESDPISLYTKLAPASNSSLASLADLALNVEGMSGRSLVNVVTVQGSHKFIGRLNEMKMKYMYSETSL